jgi:hypothetical protein
MNADKPKQAKTSQDKPRQAKTRPKQANSLQSVFICGAGSFGVPGKLKRAPPKQSR